MSDIDYEVAFGIAAGDLSKCEAKLSALRAENEKLKAALRELDDKLTRSTSAQVMRNIIRAALNETQEQG
jgi:cell shape-determining protein MreC